MSNYKNSEDLYKDLINCLAGQPKSKEIVHGEWIEHDEDFGYECPVCHDTFMLYEGTPKDNHYFFCPNCGEDLRGEQG